MNGYIEKKVAVPLWAAFGAPLVGVPLLVALLAMASPGVDARSVDPNAEVVTERVEAEWAGTGIQAPRAPDGVVLERC